LKKDKRDQKKTSSEKMPGEAASPLLRNKKASNRTNKRRGE